MKDLAVAQEELESEISLVSKPPPKSNEKRNNEFIDEDVIMRIENGNNLNNSQFEDNNLRKKQKEAKQAKEAKEAKEKKMIQAINILV